MRHLSWIVTIPVAVIVVVFAVANRQDATLSFWPLSWAPERPVYQIVLGCLLVGFVLGAAVAWLAAGPRRRRARQTAERARDLARRLAELQRSQGSGPGTGGSRAVTTAAGGEPRGLPNGPGAGQRRESLATGDPAASLERLPGA